MDEARIMELPEEYLPSVINHIGSFHNDTEDFSRAHIKSSIKNIYPLFVVLYFLFFACGLSSNICMLHHIVKNRLYHQDVTHLFLGNLAASNIIKSLFVLPFTFVNLIVHNWLFGKTFCYILPMTQDIPIHASILTHLMIAVHRHRCILHPTKLKMPAALITFLIWLVSTCLILPYAVYVHYIDLEKYLGEVFKGSGICAVSVESIHDYMRGMFVVLYVCPVSIIAFLYIKISREIKNKEVDMVLSDYEFSPDSDRTEYLDISWADSNKEARISSSVIDYRSSLSNSRSETRSKYSVESYNNNIDFDEDVDWTNEMKVQKYLVIMISILTLCMLPLNIIRLIKHILEENEDNKGHFDLIYIIFVWISFLPVNTTPLAYWVWHRQQL